jgi:hypothetical protein
VADTGLVAHDFSDASTLQEHRITGIGDLFLFAHSWVDIWKLDSMGPNWHHVFDPSVVFCAGIWSTASAVSPVTDLPFRPLAERQIHQLGAPD